MSYNYIVENGVIVPDVSGIKTKVEAEWKATAGEDATIDPSTFEGREIDAKTNRRISVARNNAELANQLNPNMANGTFVDAHLSLVGGARDSAEQSTVECDLTGVNGTVINAGSFVEDDNGNLWTLVNTTTILTGNTVTASFRSVIYDAINAGVGEINKIVSAVLGWETVNNAVIASPGKIAQGDVSAKRQRRVELGSNTRSVSYSVIAAVSKLEGVNGVQFRENFTNSDMVIDGIFLLAKSSWLCVDGGVTSEIAEAYHNNRWGTDFNGSVVEPYAVPSSGQIVNVKFDREIDKPLICRITARVGQSQDAIEDIKTAIINYANGGVEGETGFALGLDSSPFEVASAVNFQLPDIFISRCELAVVAGTLSTDTVVNDINEKASIIESNIDVVLV